MLFISLKYKDIARLKVKAWKRLYQPIISQKKAQSINLGNMAFIGMYLYLSVSVSMICGYDTWNMTIK